MLGQRQYERAGKHVPYLQKRRSPEAATSASAAAGCVRGVLGMSRRIGVASGVAFLDAPELASLLRDALAEARGSKFTLEVRSWGQPPLQSHLCIWDFASGKSVFPPSIDPNQWRKHLFLRHRHEVGALKTLIGVSDFNVLLKPVTRANLRAFVGGYVLHRTDSNDDSAATRTRLRSERDEVLRVLMQTNLRLQEFHQERNNVLVRSLHDFRAPLTAISGYCELLLGDELDPLTSGQRKILQSMRHSARRLTWATDAMFQLSVADDDESTPNLVQADLPDCIGQALEELSPLLKNKNVAVTVEVESSPENLVFEKALIQQVLVNLLETACKFTPKGGAIEIKGYPFFWERRSARATPLMDSPERRTKGVRTVNSFRIDIVDCGPAIPAVDAGRIFEEHTSYAGGQDRSGAGLGMAICRMILSRHGGHVWAENSDTGVVFSFVLPLKQTITFPAAEREGVESPACDCAEELNDGRK